MNTKVIAAILTLTATMLCGFAFTGPAEATGYPGYGPYSPEMRLQYFADETSLYAAVKAGTVDWSLWEATSAQYQDAINDPNIVLCPVSRLDMRAFSLNNNDTIAALPGVRIPTSYADFRKALWCMVDRDYYTQVICGGFATPVYVMISAPSRMWVNVTTEAFVQSAYPGYAYSLLAASNYLNAGGFTQRVGDTNPNYDPAVPGSAQYWRGYPPGHSKAGQRIDPVVFSARSDDTLRLSASAHLRDMMLKSGIPVNFIAETSGAASIRVMQGRNYMIYSAGWSTGRFATYSWSWYHTSRWVPGGSNYHIGQTSGVITSSSYDPCTQPDKRPEDLTDLDYWASKVWYPKNLTESVWAAQHVQAMSTIKYGTFIPLWGGRAFFYYRNLYGITNQDGVGPENTYSFQAVRRADGGTPIRVGHKSPPTQINQIYANWVWDVTTMGQTQDGFYNLEPYNILNEQPGLCQDWTNAPGSGNIVPGNWTDPDDGKVKSMMQYWFLEDPTDGSPNADTKDTHAGDADAEWVSQGLTGGVVLADFKKQWLGGGYEFNCWYFDNEPAGWIYGGYRDIKHIVVNKAENWAKVYFDVASYWSFGWPWGRHIYAVEPASYDQTILGWKKSPLSTQETRNFAGLIPAGTYLNDLIPVEGSAYRIPQRLRGAVVEVIEVTVTTGTTVTTLNKATKPHEYNPLVPGSAGGDWSIVGSSVNGPRIRLFTTVPAGSTLTVKYWARGDPAGYWPGNLPERFETTLIGTGQYYMTDFLAGAGGYATYKANVHNFMATPPPGEIDWYYEWYGTTQPRDGWYQLKIFDFSTASYCLYGSGNAIPTRNWIAPAADTVAPLGVIDSADIGYMMTRYLDYFSSPYPNPPPPPP